ncbi:MAG: metal-dependent hydrolase [Bacteroidales bacterium]
MDSLTHIVLGATVAEVIIGKKVGNKALVIGAIAGNIPDFDSIFSPLLSPVDALFFHRGISHSFFILLLLAPLIAFALSKIDKDSRLKYKDWLWGIGLPWLSHLIVDIFNTYGTGIWEPFSSIRVSYDSVAIIDVFLLAILIPATIVIWLLKIHKSLRRVVAWISIAFVTLYFGLSVVIKENLESTIKKELSAEGKSYIRIQTAALPLSNLIWMVVVEDSTNFNVEQRNLLNINKPLQKNRLAKNHQLLSSENYYEIDRIKNFTKGLYTVEKTNKGWNIYDLRYSSLAQNYPEAYVFKFDVEKKENAIHIARTHPKRHINTKNIKEYIKRIIKRQ